MPFSLRLAVLVAAGAAAGLHLSPPQAVPVLGLALAATVTAVVAHRRGASGAAWVLLPVALTAAVSVRSALTLEAATHPSLVQWFDAVSGRTTLGDTRFRDTPLGVRARLLRDATPTAFGVQMPLLVHEARIDGRWTTITGGVLVTVSGNLVSGTDDWRAGRAVQLPIALRRPAAYRNAGLADASDVIARLGTPLLGSVKSGALVEVEGRGAWWDEWAADVRARVRDAMARHVAPRDPLSAAVGTAILIGDRAQLPPDVERRLQEAGTYHVIAISGGNIAMLAGTVLAVLWLIHIRFATAAAVATLVLVGHAWIVGGGPSVLRATAMASVYLLLRVIDQRTAPVHALSLTMAGLLLWNPLEIAGAGFWLTFGASAALLLSASRWGEPANREPANAWWLPLRALLLASLAVEIVLMPVSAYVFERVTLAGIGLNLIAVPAMGLVQASASLCLVSDVLGLAWVADVTGWLTHMSARVLLSGSSLVAVVPWATWRVPPPSMVMLVVYYAILTGWWWVSRPPVDVRWRRVLATYLTVGVAAGWGWIATAPLRRGDARGDGALHLTVMDVGQGDSILVTAPNGRTLLVDAGGTPGSVDIGERVLGPALRARRLRRLDYVAVTHADQDHVGGAAATVREFRPREVWAGVPVSGHAPLEQVRAVAREMATPWRWLQRGDRVELGALDLRVHHPPLADWERQRVRNDDSVVLELRHGLVSIWLMGDITRAVEIELLAAVEPGRIHIVKAAHHGSLTSSSAEWVRRLRPALVLISAGRTNLFGHPAAAVLQRYRDVGAEIVRTDQDGQIEVVTNGIAVEVRTFTGRRWRLR